MGITIRALGNFKNIESFIKNTTSITRRQKRLLEKYGQEGVNALATNTPKRTGETAASWFYEINENSKGIELIWKNSNIVDGVPIVLLLHYGHGTRDGGYVQGRDFINPSLRPIFDRISNDLWREVRK